MTVAATIAFLTAFMVSHTVFSSMGEPMEGQKGRYILALLVTLIISGVGSGIRVAIAPKLRHVAFVSSGTASGALLAFYYGGLAAEKNPQVAIISAIAGGLLMGFLSLKVRTGVVAVVVAIAAAVTGYGLAFWSWVIAIAFLSGQKLIWGLALTMLSLAYIGLTISSLSLAIQEIQTTLKTSSD